MKLITAAMALAAVSLRPSSAAAEVTVWDKDGLALSFDGRTSGFYSYEWGDVTPDGVVGTPFQAAPNEQDPPAPGAPPEQAKFSVSRVHSGYVGNILGFKVVRKLSETTKITGRIALWWSIETDQFRAYSSMRVDPRESYAKLEGKWGGLLAGRTLGLHDRGGTQIDYLYANGYSIGSPCNATQQGPLCGHIGYGYQFPAFNAGIVYNTPSISGAQLSVGVYDPARIGFGSPELGRLPYPRVESELNYDYTSPSFNLALYANGMWQHAGGVAADEDVTVDALGVAGGARVEVGGVWKLGLGANIDKGGGEFTGLADEIPIDKTGELRKVRGFLAQTMVTLGSWDFATGLGQTAIQASQADVDEGASVIKTRTGYNFTVNYHYGPAVFNWQYFGATHTYTGGQKQALHFLHTGMTFTW